MNVVIGLIFIALILMIFLRWVVNMGRIGFMMIGITICVPAGMGCVLNLHGSQRLWGIVPLVLFFVLAVMIFRGSNRKVKG